MNARQVIIAVIIEVTLNTVTIKKAKYFILFMRYSPLACQLTYPRHRYAQISARNNVFARIPNRWPNNAALLITSRLLTGSNCQPVLQQ